MKHFFREFRSQESGASAIEYALICSLVILVTMGAFYSLGNNTAALWADIANHI